MEKTRLDKLQIALDKEKAQLDSLCLLPDSKQKIQLIAAGVLRKNFKFVQKLEEKDNNLKQLAEKIKHTKEQLEILQTRLSLDKPTTCYKVTSSKHSQKSIASLKLSTLWLRVEARTNFIYFLSKSVAETIKSVTTISLVPLKISVCPTA